MYRKKGNWMIAKNNAVFYQFYETKTFKKKWLKKVSISADSNPRLGSLSIAVQKSKTQRFSPLRHGEPIKYRRGF